MAAQGATLQNYNNELVKCVDDLKEKREEVNKPTRARGLIARLWVWAGSQTAKEKRKRRHEGGVEPLALSRSTDLKSAPRTDEDHHGS